jgi:hypothetical protein
MPAGADPKSGAAPPPILATTEGATASAVASAGTLRAGGASFRTAAGEIDWDEIWKRMPQPVARPSLSAARSSLPSRHEAGDVGSSPILPTGGALAGDKRGSSAAGAPVAVLPEGGQGPGGEGGGPGLPSTLQSAQTEMRQSLALTPQSGFAETTLQGDGMRGGKTISVIAPFGSGTASNAAATGLVSVKGGTLDAGGRARVEGKRDAAPPLPAQIAVAVQGADAAREAAESLLARSRRDGLDAAALRIEAQKAAIPPEPLGDLSPLGIQRLEDERLTLAARAADRGMAAVTASRAAAGQIAQAESSDATALRLMERWLAQEPGPMEGAALYAAMVEAPPRPPPPSSAGAPRALPPSRAPVAPPSAEPPARACCSSCAAGDHGHHVPAAPKGGCGCGTRSTPQVEPPAHWSGAPIGPESPSGPSGRAARTPQRTPCPPAILPQAAVMRCAEGRVLRPLLSFLDCAWPGAGSPIAAERDIVEPPQALSPRVRAAVPVPPGGSGISRARSASRSVVAATDSGAVCRLPGGARLPLFSWAPLCPATVHDAGFDGATVFAVGPMQDHQSGGAGSVYRTPRQCHCECHCKYAGSVYLAAGASKIDRRQRREPIGPTRVWDHPPGGPFPRGPFPVGGCVQPADARVPAGGARPALLAGGCPPTMSPPLFDAESGHRDIVGTEAVEPPQALGVGPRPAPS